MKKNSKDGFFKVRKEFVCSIYKQKGVENYGLHVFHSKEDAVKRLEKEIEDLKFELASHKKALDYFKKLKG